MLRSTHVFGTPFLSVKGIVGNKRAGIYLFVLTGRNTHGGISLCPVTIPLLGKRSGSGDRKVGIRLSGYLP